MGRDVRRRVWEGTEPDSLKERSAVDRTGIGLWIAVAIIFVGCGGAWIWSLWRAKVYERQLEREYGKEALDQIRALFRK